MSICDDGAIWHQARACARARMHVYHNGTIIEPRCCFCRFFFWLLVANTAKSWRTSGHSPHKETRLQSWHGASWQGTARHGTARHGTALTDARHGTALLHTSEHGTARHEICRLLSCHGSCKLEPRDLLSAPPGGGNGTKFIETMVRICTAQRCAHVHAQLNRSW